MRNLLLLLTAILLTSLNLSYIQHRSIVDQANQFANDLEEVEGYSSDWAHKRAYVEFGLLPVDAEYIAIIED